MCDLVKIGQRIKDARTELGFTQEELGKAIGVNKSTIQRYETGKINKLKLPVIESIAKVLMVNPDWITLHSDIRKPQVIADFSEFLDFTAGIISKQLMENGFERLDKTDQGIIIGEIRQMLRADKYKNTDL